MDHTCTTCHRGCGCALTDPGCEHYGCYGRFADGLCPGAAAEEQRYADALRIKREHDARDAARRARLDAMYEHLAGSL